MKNSGDLKHICFICHEYPPASHGGIGSFTQTLARALSGRGIRVTVVGLAQSKKTVVENDGGVSVVRLAHFPIPRVGFIFNSLRIWAALKEIDASHSIDIIEGQENSFSFLPAGLHPHKVIRMHGGHHFISSMLNRPPALWRGSIEKRSFRKADHFCAVSGFVADHTRRLLGLRNASIEILPNPVDSMFWEDHSSVAVERNSMGFVGTLYELKGVRHLVQALEKIISVIPDARLYLVGRDTTPPGAGRSFLADILQGLDQRVLDRITYLGPMEHEKIPAFMAKMHVLVFPSYVEAQGVVVAEAMALGKPVVFSNIGIGAEMIQEGETGLLCDPHQPGSIAEEVLRVLQDDHLGRRLGAASRKRALENFSLDVLTEKNLRFYGKCLN